MKLKDKVAIITGAARGIGQSIAIEMVKEGVAVSLVDISPMAKTLKKIAKLNGKSISVEANLRMDKDIMNIVPETLSQLNKIDILVNVAGIFPKSRILDITREEWEKVMDINLTSVYLLCREISKYFIKNTIRGKIINISSTAGFYHRVEPYYCHYSASKAGVISITKSFAYELMEYGINVNSIAPGGIATEGVNKLTESLQSKGILEEVAEAEKSKKQPIKIIANPKEISKLAVFLASKDADYITGAVIPVDGGRSIL